MNRDKCKRALFLCVKYLVSAAVVAVVVGPLLVTLFTSVKTQAQLASTSPILPPAPGAWNWDNYAEVLGAKLLPVAVKNTAVILVVSIFFNVLLGSVTAYCLQRFEFQMCIRDRCHIVQKPGMQFQDTSTQGCRVARL